MSHDATIARGERTLIRDRLDRLHLARESGDPRRIARVESKLSAFLRRHHNGRTFSYLAWTWTVDDATPEGKVRIGDRIELD